MSFHVRFRTAGFHPNSIARKFWDDKTKNSETVPVINLGQLFGPTADIRNSGISSVVVCRKDRMVFGAEATGFILRWHTDRRVLRSSFHCHISASKRNLTIAKTLCIHNAAWKSDNTLVYLVFQNRNMHTVIHLKLII